MPGTNLTREEAATRAALLDVTSYSIDLDLTTGDKTFASTTTVRFTCREPGAETFADLVDAIVHEITLNGEPLDEASAYQNGRIALTGLQAENELVVRADCAYSHSGEGLHRFVDPVDGRVYLYTQFEVPDARRVFTTFEQPDLKSVFTWTVTAPAGWKVVSNAPTPEPEDLGDDKARWRFPESKRMSTYITALIAGEYHEHRDIYDGQARHDPARPLLPAGAGGAPRHRRAAEDDQAGLRVLRGGLRLPLPVREVRPALRAGVQRRRDGERRCRHVPRRVPPPQPSGRRVLRVPLLGDPPRDGAHVVRRPGDHEVVGRPLAERVVRRVGVLPRRRREHRVHRVVDRVHQRPQELGAAPGPAAVDPPDRGRQLRPARGRGELRRHHLRQGRLGPQAAGRLGRARAVPGRACGSTSRTTPTRNSEFVDLLTALEKASGRELDAWAKEWLQTSGVNTLAPEFELADDGTYASFGVRQTAAGDNADPAPAPPRHRPVRRGGRPPGPSPQPRDRHRGRPDRGRRAGRREAARPAAAQRRRPQPTPRSASTSARWPPSWVVSGCSTTRWRGRCAGARPGT